jgi:hypothetical protein
MTDTEAYELLLKYCGGEKGLIMIKDMIHMVGVEGTVNNILRAYGTQYKNEMSEDFKEWVAQSLRHVQKLMNEPVN